MIPYGLIEISSRDPPDVYCLLKMQEGANLGKKIELIVILIAHGAMMGIGGRALFLWL